MDDSGRRSLVRSKIYRFHKTFPHPHASSTITASKSGSHREEDGEDCGVDAIEEKELAECSFSQILTYCKIAKLWGCSPACRQAGQLPSSAKQSVIKSTALGISRSASQS